MRKINQIVIHCSDSDIQSHDNIETIRDWHKQRGFDDIGYHFVILKSGQIEIGRPLHVQGAHCKGHNQDSIGICLTGKKNFSSQQLIALGLLCKDLMIQLGIDVRNVYPHNHYDSGKTCPNFELPPFDK